MVSPFLSPATVWHMMQKIRQHGDDPAGATVPRLIEVGNCGSPEGRCLPHHSVPHRRHYSTATGNQDKPCPPTNPSPTPNPNTPASAALLDASAGPTVRSHEAGGDANRAVGSRPTEPPPSLQFQNGCTATRDLEYGGAAKERLGYIREARQAGPTGT